MLCYYILIGRILFIKFIRIFLHCSISGLNETKQAAKKTPSVCNTKCMGTIINIKYRLQIVNGNNPLFIMLFLLYVKTSAVKKVKVHIKMIV